jgi:hypothetical protein
MQTAAIVPYIITTVSVRTAFDVLDIGFRALNNTSRTITGLVSTPSRKSNKHLTDYLTSTDLVFKLDIIRSFLTEIVAIESVTLRAAIDGVTATLVEIERVTSKIQNNVAYNHSLYIKSFFKIDITDSINQLEQLVNTLFGRFNLLCAVQLGLKRGSDPV